MSETAPFEVPICFYLFVIGTWNLIAGLTGVPVSVQHTYPKWLTIAWAASIALGSGAALVGRYVQRFRLESSGLAFMLAACGIYIYTVLSVNGLTAIFASGAYAAIATGCIIRMKVIRRSHKAQQVATEILKANGDAPL